MTREGVGAWLSGIGAMWPVIGGVVVFVVTMWSDVDRLKGDTKELKDNVGILNQKINQRNQWVMNLLSGGQKIPLIIQLMLFGCQ